MPDLKDILNEDDELRNDDLLNYLRGNISREDQHKVERQMADSEFVDDAVEGLRQLSGKKPIEHYVEDLNRQLHKQIAGKKQRREKRKLKDNSWITIAVAVVLALCILAFIVVRFYQARSESPVPPASKEQRD